MKIQVISYKGLVKYGDEHQYTYSTLSEPQTFDAFDLNIISLQTPELWKNQEDKRSSINAINDFESLHKLISTCKKSNLIVCFPQNYIFQYYYSGFTEKKYVYRIPIKDLIADMIKCLSHLLPILTSYSMVYENSTTECGQTKFKAAFYFDQYYEQFTPLTKCNGGEHATTVLYNDRMYLTTLDLSQSDIAINDFLKALGLIQKPEELPAWVSEYEFLDDQEQKTKIDLANAEISRQQQIISNADKKIAENMRYKKVLFESGDELIQVVFDMLEKLLNCNLSAFIDEKKEDFRISLNGITFIGEVKGITSNVKSENISQLDVHCQGYSDTLQENGQNETIKGLLIINPLRNKPLGERGEVHETQITLAVRNESLIITTDVLLILFERFLLGQVTTEKVVEMFANRTGLLAVSDFS